MRSDAGCATARMLGDEAMFRRQGFWWTGTVLLFLWSCWPYLRQPPGADDWKNLWLVQNVPFWDFLWDPLAAGYTFRFFFEPTWPLTYYVDAPAAAVLGVAGHHVVNAISALAIAALLAHMVRIAGASGRVAVMAALIFLFSPPVWFAVGFGAARNYLVATTFALGALLPFWHAALTRRPCGRSAIVLSALLYGLAAGSKEATASLPLALFALDLMSGRSLLRAVANMLGHTAVLLALVCWRLHILGGLGGYWMEPTVHWDNLYTGVPMLGEFLWGAPWPWLLLVPWILMRRDVAAVFAVSYASSFAPFVFAGELDTGPHYPISAVRFLLFWAFAVGIVGAAAGRWVAAARTRGARHAVLVAMVVVLLSLQWQQRSVVDDALRRLLPREELPLAIGDEGLQVVTEHSKSLAYAHQSRRDARAWLGAYQTPPSLQITQALGFAAPAGVARRNIRAELPPLRLAALEIGASRIWVDDRGRFHIRLAESAGEDLSLTWIHENGPTRWVVTLPIGRRNIDFPLTHSIRAIILSRPAVPTERLEYFLWESPFFRSSYP